jgi:hypothetical protein
MKITTTSESLKGMLPAITASRQFPPPTYRPLLRAVTCFEFDRTIDRTFETDRKDLAEELKPDFFRSRNIALLTLPIGSAVSFTGS